jgi:hypothetical protein
MTQIIKLTNRGGVYDYYINTQHIVNFRPARFPRDVYLKASGSGLERTEIPIRSLVKLHNQDEHLEVDQTPEEILNMIRAPKL